MMPPLLQSGQVGPGAATAAGSAATAAESTPNIARLEIFHGYIWVFVIAFGVTILATPLMRRLAIANGIIDHPTSARKGGRLPVAYLGGVAVFLGLMGGVLFSYLATALGPLGAGVPLRASGGRRVPRAGAGVDSAGLHGHHAGRPAR
jgi:hypothetical protein